jgi:hypothetical protein
VLADYSCFTLHRFSSRVLTLCPLIVLLSTAGQDHDRDALAVPARNRATTASTICVRVPVRIAMAVAVDYTGGGSHVGTWTSPG